MYRCYGHKAMSVPTGKRLVQHCLLYLKPKIKQPNLYRQPGNGLPGNLAKPLGRCHWQLYYCCRQAMPIHGLEWLGQYRQLYSVSTDSLFALLCPYRKAMPMGLDCLVNGSWRMYSLGRRNRMPNFMAKSLG